MKFTDLQKITEEIAEQSNLNKYGLHENVEAYITKLDKTYDLDKYVLRNSERNGIRHIRLSPINIDPGKYPKGDFKSSLLEIKIANNSKIVVDLRNVHVKSTGDIITKQNKTEYSAKPGKELIIIEKRQIDTNTHDRNLKTTKLNKRQKTEKHCVIGVGDLIIEDSFYKSTTYGNFQPNKQFNAILTKGLIPQNDNLKEKNEMMKKIERINSEISTKNHGDFSVVTYEILTEEMKKKQMGVGLIPDQTKELNIKDLNPRISLNEIPRTIDAVDKVTDSLIYMKMHGKR